MANGVKHTPGPWVVIPAQPYDGDEEESEGAYTSPASIEGSNGDPVCVFGSAEGSGCLFENEADYHLIAAAPEMLEALKVTARGLEGEFGPRVAEVNFPALYAAIAKAEGRS